MEIAQSDNLKPKTHVLLLGIVLSILNAALPEVIPENGVSQQIIILLFAIGFNVLTVFWCVYDSRERGETLGRYFTLSVVIFGVFALFYYFLKTRGFNSGLIAIGKFVGLFLGVNIILAIIFTVLNSIFEPVLK
jgi:apolipoprotein N-acyltransferase